MRIYFLIVIGLLMLLTGCATDNQLGQQTRQIKNGDYNLSTLDVSAGSIYELRVYVIAAGDTISKIAGKFQISVSALKALNPELQPNRLLIGQKLRVYERKQN